MRAFEYASAATLDEAIALLGQSGDGTTRALAGGTDLLTLIKADVATPSRLIDIKRVPELASGIAVTDGEVTIGALTPLAEIETHALICERYPALAEAAALAATPQLRNMATIGGNLLQRPRCWYYRSPHFHCWLKGGEECQARDGENQQHAIFDVSLCVATHPSDLATALVALDAIVHLRGAGGERTVPLREFFAPPTDERRTETALGDGEIVTALALLAPGTATRSTYLKAMDRKTWAFALVGVAAALRVEDGRIADARLVLGGVAPVPLRAEAAERLLIGAAPEEATFARAATAALDDATPLAHNGYKLPLARGLIGQALAALAVPARP